MIERFAYLIKTSLPGIFPVIAYAGRVVTVLRFSRQRSKALAEASIQGEVVGQRAVMRPLGLDDLDTLQGFAEAMPESHLVYFHPHGFGRVDFAAVLRSHSFMTYGLFVYDALAGYALLVRTKLYLSVFFMQNPSRTKCLNAGPERFLI